MKIDYTTTRKSLLFGKTDIGETLKDKWRRQFMPSGLGNAQKYEPFCFYTPEIRGLTYGTDNSPQDRVSYQLLMRQVDRNQYLTKRRNIRFDIVLLRRILKENEAGFTFLGDAQAKTLHTSLSAHDAYQTILDKFASLHGTANQEDLKLFGNDFKDKDIPEILYGARIVAGDGPSCLQRHPNTFPIGSAPEYAEFYLGDTSLKTVRTCAINNIRAAEYTKRPFSWHSRPTELDR